MRPSAEDALTDDAKKPISLGKVAAIVLLLVVAAVVGVALVARQAEPLPFDYEGF